MTTSTQEVLTPGTTFGRYAIVRRLGAGGMGAVYEAVHHDLKKRVAIKALLPAMTENAEVRARFLREGEAAARIRHPHVVDVYDVGFENGIAFMVMEYLEGEDLGGRLRRERPLGAEKLADIMLPVCSAVFTAHQHGVIHRDLKPANIFLAKGPFGEIVPKVLDFGISKLLADPLTNEAAAGLTTTGAVLGTPFYMSPEQAHGGVPVDARSDQYSLGVILYQCAVGQRPFEAPSTYQVLHRIVEGIFEPPRKIRPEIPPALEQVILRAMHKDAGHRFADVAELGGALLPFASERARVLFSPFFLTGGHPPSGSIPPAEPLAPEAPPSAAALQEPVASVSNTFAQAGSVTVAPKPQLPLLVFLVASAMVLTVGLGVWVFTGLGNETVVTQIEEPQAPPAAPPATYSVHLEVEPREATIEIDGQALGSGRFDGSYPRDGKSHRLRVSAPGYRSADLAFLDTAPTSPIKLEAIPQPVAAPAQPTRPAAEARPAKRPQKEKPPVQQRPAVGANQAPIIE